MLSLLARTKGGRYEHMPLGLTISERAAKRIKEILALENREGYGLRVQVRGGGGSALKYKFDFDTERTGDRAFEKDETKVLIDLKSLVYLNGTELDYQEGLWESSFVIRRPGPKQICGCETSLTACSDAPQVPNIW